MNNYVVKVAHSHIHNSIAQCSTGKAYNIITINKSTGTQKQHAWPDLAFPSCPTCCLLIKQTTLSLTT